MTVYNDAKRSMYQKVPKLGGLCLNDAFDHKSYIMGNSISRAMIKKLKEWIEVKCVVVTTLSPRWNVIGSIRWEKLSKYLSENNDVVLVTTCVPTGFSLTEFSQRSFDLQKAKLVEIPFKSYVSLSGNVILSRPEKQSIRSSVILRSAYKAAKKLLGPARRLFSEVLYLTAPMSLGPDGYSHVWLDSAEFQRAVEEIVLSTPKNTKIVLITTFGPWFTLRLGRRIKRKYPERVLWIADFRDPSFNVHSNRITHLPIYKRITKLLLKDADAILTVSKSLVEDYYGPLLGNKVYFLPNGHDYDPCVGNPNVKIREPRREFVIGYTGTLYPRTRTVTPFVEALCLLADNLKRKNVKFVYAGISSAEVQTQFEKYGISDILTNLGPVPHNKAREIQLNSDLLLLIVYTGVDSVIGRGIRTGKLYEYLASFKPILAVAPKDWEMKEEIESDGVSRVFERHEINDMARYIKWLAENRPSINYEKRRAVVEKYSYKNLAIELEKILNDLLKPQKKFDSAMNDNSID